MKAVLEGLRCLVELVQRRDIGSLRLAAEGAGRLVVGDVDHEVDVGLAVRSALEAGALERDAELVREGLVVRRGCVSDEDVAHRAQVYDTSVTSPLSTGPESSTRRPSASIPRARPRRPSTVTARPASASREASSPWSEARPPPSHES